MTIVIPTSAKSSLQNTPIRGVFNAKLNYNSHVGSCNSVADCLRDQNRNSRTGGLRIALLANYYFCNRTADPVNGCAYAA